MQGTGLIRLRIGIKSTYTYTELNEHPINVGMTCSEHSKSSGRYWLSGPKCYLKRMAVLSEQHARLHVKTRIDVFDKQANK